MSTIYQRPKIRQNMLRVSQKRAITEGGGRQLRGVAARGRRVGGNGGWGTGVS